jgi:membrane protease YdiL (CAAX protease family)
MFIKSNWRPTPIVWPAASFKIVPTVLVLVGAFVVFTVADLSALISSMITGDLSFQQLQKANGIPPGVELWSESAIYLALGLYLLAVLPKLSGLSLAALGIRAPTMRELATGLAGGIAGILTFQVAYFVIAAATHRHDTESAARSLDQTRGAIAWIVVAVISVVLAPLVEELFFRLYIFNALLRRFGFGFAATASATLFGLAHASSAWQVLTIALPIGCSGFVLAYVYARTRCYWSNVISHGVFNLLAVALAFLRHAHG